MAWHSLQPRSSALLLKKQSFDQCSEAASPDTWLFADRNTNNLPLVQKDAPSRANVER